MRAKKALRIARGAMLLLSASAGVAQADLVASWSFDGNVNDSSGFANNGTLMNGAGFSSDVPSLFAGGQSLSIGGGTQHVLVPDSSSLDITDALTIAGWVKPIGNVMWDGIVAKSPSDGSLTNHAGNYEFRIENGTRALTFHHQRGGTNDTVAYPSTGAILQGLWQHVAVTVQNGGQARFYINGSPSGTASVNGLFGATNNSPLYIGTRADLFTTMDGLIDELSIYNEVLSAAAIQQLAGGVQEGHPGLSPVFAKASSQFLADGRLAAHAVNGAGLSGKRHANNPPGGTMWLTDGADLAPSFEIDLGGVHKVNDLRVWNYNETANDTCCLGRGVKTADIFVANVEGEYPATPTIANAQFDIAPGTVTDFSQVLSLGGIEARYIKLNITSNHGDAQFTGLSEVKATGTPVVGLAPLATKIHAASSSLGGTFSRLAEHTVTGAGKEFGDRHSPVPDGGMWLTQGTFQGTPDLDPSITFDLGSEQAISLMKLWNYNEYRPDLANRTEELLNRGIRTGDIEIAGEDLVFQTLIEDQEFERAPNLALLGITDPYDFSQLIDFGGALARYVRINIDSNHGGKNFNDPLSTDGFNEFAGLSEVQFFAVIPEPSSAAVLLLGAGGLAGARRRRRV